MRVDDFFGLNLDLTHFQVDNVLELIGLRRTIERLAPVQKLIAESGKEHPIVSIGKRQFALKALRPLYDKGVQAHDPRFSPKRSIPAPKPTVIMPPRKNCFSSVSSSPQGKP